VACGTLMKCCPEHASQKVAFHNSLILLVPGVGFESTTCGLQNAWIKSRVPRGHSVTRHVVTGVTVQPHEVAVLTRDDPEKALVLDLI
jgi:hypothetical protein